MKRRTKLGIGTGLVATMLGGCATNQEVKRKDPLELFRIQSVYDEETGEPISKNLAYLIDFLGTPDQIKTQDPDSDTNEMRENTPWDSISFYSLPEGRESFYERPTEQDQKSVFERVQDSIRAGDYIIKETYINKDLERRILSGKKDLLSRLSWKLGIPEDTKIKIVDSPEKIKEEGVYYFIRMNPEQAKTNSIDIFNYFP